MSAIRALTDDMDPDVVRAVDARLAEVREEHGVAIRWAIESGSRAWGFPSPDSDYDCRFFFVRSRAAYLDPWPALDFIETPLDALLDVNGWDLVKAVRLAVRSNATVVEWLRSPLVYDGEPGFRDDLLEVFDAVASRVGTGRHYLHVGRDHWDRTGARVGEPAPLKRVFYALRPAAALHWMLANPDLTSPPMNLQQLLNEAPVPPGVAEAVSAMVAAKARTRELGTGGVEPVLREWIGAQFEAAASEFDAAGPPGPEPRARAAEMFRSMLDRWAP